MVNITKFCGKTFKMFCGKTLSQAFQCLWHVLAHKHWLMPAVSKKGPCLYLLQVCLYDNAYSLMTAQTDMIYMIHIILGPVMVSCTTTVWLHNTVSTVLLLPSHVPGISSHPYQAVYCMANINLFKN